MYKHLIFIVLVLVSPFCDAETLLVDKKQFEISNFKTFNGNIIQDVKVGWESYGKLNKAKDNVILITHYFSGNSHAAGKYTKSDLKPGYWDAIIGPGKAIDTNKYFVISSDTLVNASVHNKYVITTGPATINPATNKPYGLDFPVVTIRDFVNVQQELITSLGIKKLHAVIGASMGSLQAIDWATAYPNMVERVISVIGLVESDAWTTAALEHWVLPIKLDPNWNEGNYYQGPAPIAGITASLMLITQQSMHPKLVNKLNPKYFALEESPLNDINSSFSVVNWLTDIAENRAKQIDANHLLYLVRANQLFIAGSESSLEKGLNKIKAKTLFLPATNDLILLPYMAQRGKEVLLSLGKKVEYEELEGISGHLDGLYTLQQKAALISDFLAN